MGLGSEAPPAEAIVQDGDICEYVYAGFNAPGFLLYCQEKLCLLQRVK